MARLVADLGGTNCRLALVAVGGQSGDQSFSQSFISSKSYRNEEFANFTDLISRHLADAGAPKISAMVIAVAGPVSGEAAQLTNRGWRISAQELSTQLNGRPVHLLNDLSALGHSLPMLRGDDLLQIHSAYDTTIKPQKLVIGIGTGFNLSPLTITKTGVTCLEAEYGHVALPLDLYQALATRLGDQAAEFRTVECCFSGRGFEALFAAFSPDTPPLPAAEIMATAQARKTREFLAFYAQLLAILSRNLLKGFMPRGGIYFAGTVARSLLCSPAKEAFVAQFKRVDPQFPDITAPVFCILDDKAALKGCAGFTLPL